MSSFSAPHFISLVPAAQLISEKDHVSIENLSEESLISREELVFEEDDMTKSTRRPKRQRPELLHPIPQEDSIRNAASQSEETTELTPRAGRSQGQGEEAGREALNRKTRWPDITLGEKVGDGKRKEAEGEQKLKVNEIWRIH